MEKLLTIKELCELLQVSQSLVYKWVHYEYIPCIKLGSGVRFFPKDIEVWVAKRKRKGRVSYKMELPV